MNKITEITRRDIIDIINNGFIEQLDGPVYDNEKGAFVTERAIFMPFYGRLDELGFFSRLYDLTTLPSYDHRYRDALGDIKCHLGWGDYEKGWFFHDRRFKLLPENGDEPLLNFICEMLHPAVRATNSPWKLYLEKFNELLRADGYEIYAAQHISGRDVFKARPYTLSEAPLLPDNLFTERYKELISYGNGNPIDNISGNIEYNAKKHFAKVMREFAEPISIQRSRYDRWIDNTNALSEAIDHLNEYMDMPVIEIELDVYSGCSLEESLASQFTPFLFDVIEYQFEELSSGEKGPFQTAINDSMRRDNLSFRLSDRGLIELLTDQEVLSPEFIQDVENISEPGLRALLKEAIERHMQPNIHAHRDAVEKIWDALERIKTYYPSMDKKASASKIVNDMSGGNPAFHDLFDTEFKTLTDIGNGYRIRHHETNAVDITDPRHYDYFFNRCLSLIALAIQYLQR